MNANRDTRRAVAERIERIADHAEPESRVGYEGIDADGQRYVITGCFFCGADHSPSITCSQHVEGIVLCGGDRLADCGTCQRLIADRELAKADHGDECSCCDGLRLGVYETIDGHTHAEQIDDCSACRTIADRLDEAFVASMTDADVLTAVIGSLLGESCPLCGERHI